MRIRDWLARVLVRKSYWIAEWVEMTDDRNALLADALRYGCSACSAPGHRLHAAYCTECGRPMAWPEGVPRLSHADLRREIRKLRIDNRHVDTERQAWRTIAQRLEPGRTHWRPVLDAELEPRLARLRERGLL